MTQLVISSAGSRTETLLSWITLLSNRKRSFSRQERWVKKKLNEPEPYLHVHWWRDIHNNLAVSISEHWHESHCFLMGRDLRQAWVEIGIGWTWTSISCLLMKRSSRFSNWSVVTSSTFFTNANSANSDATSDQPGLQPVAPPGGLVQLDYWSNWNWETLKQRHRQSAWPSQVQPQPDLTKQQIKSNR